MIQFSNAVPGRNRRLSVYSSPQLAHTLRNVLQFERPPAHFLKVRR